MRIDLAHDRTDHAKGIYHDAASERVGVFAALEDHELSDAERARIARGVLTDEQPVSEPEKLWGVKDILARVTKLYARFVRPQTTDQSAEQKEGDG